VPGGRNLSRVTIDQDYCDWCLKPLNELARTQSLALGLPLEQAWACSSCVATGGYRTPPDGWDGDLWPSRHTYLVEPADRVILVNALIEVLHGPDASEERDFTTRIGASRAEALDLLRRFNSSS